MKMIGQKPIVIHSTSLWVWNNVSGTFSRFICTVSWSLAEPVLFDYCPRPCMQAGMGDSVMPCSATKTGNMAIWQHLTNMTACGKLVSCQVVTQQTTLLLCAFQTGQGPIEVYKCLNCLTPNSVIWVCQAIVEKFDLVQFHSETKAALIPASFSIQSWKYLLLEYNYSCPYAPSKC